MSLLLSTSDSAKLEPKRQNRWLLSFLAIPGTNKQDSLSFCCHTGKRPQLSFNETEIHRLNEKWRFANKPDFSPVDFSFYDFIAPENGESAYTVINKWRNKVYNPLTGEMGYAIEYTTHATLSILDPKGNAIQNWTLHYIWPLSIDFGTLDVGSEAICEVAVSFRYAFAIDYKENPPILDSIIASGEQYPKII